MMDALPALSIVADRADEVPGLRLRHCDHCRRPILEDCPDCIPELIALHGDPRPLRILAALVLTYGPTTAPEVARYTGRRRDVAANALRHMTGRGEAHRIDYGVYCAGPGAA